MEEARAAPRSAAELEDAAGRRFWEAHFGARTEASWDAFAAALFAFLEQPRPPPSDIKFRCLAAVFSDIGGPGALSTVTLDVFHRFLLWLAPLDAAVLQRLLELLAQPWFHGSLSAAAASDRVREAGDGAFLVRFSNQPGAYAITCRGGEQIRHYRIARRAAGRYVLGQVECRSLHDVVQRFAAELALVTPCPGSAFQALLRRGASRYEDFYDDA